MLVSGRCEYSTHSGRNVIWLDRPHCDWISGMCECNTVLSFTSKLKGHSNPPAPVRQSKLLSVWAATCLPSQKRKRKSALEANDARGCQCLSWPEVHRVSWPAKTCGSDVIIQTMSPVTDHMLMLGVNAADDLFLTLHTQFVFVHMIYSNPTGSFLQGLHERGHAPQWKNF